MQTCKVDGRTVKVGDWVCFKSDIEQAGKIVHIGQGMFGGTQLVLENVNGFHGDYIGGQVKTVQRAQDCWVE